MNIRSTQLASLTLLGLVACAVPPPIDAHWTRAPELSSVNPNDVAVLKIEDASRGSGAAGVVEFMREEIQRALIRRNYAPLRSVAVDAHLRGNLAPGTSIIEASYLKTIATKAKEDAILAVRVTHWDETMLLINNRVRFDAQVTLFGSVVGKVLWSLEMRGEVVAGGGKAAPREPAARARSAAREFVLELIGRLPRRQM